MAVGMPNCAANSNAAASAREQARVKHASAQRYVHTSKHSTAKDAVFCVVVLAGQDAGDSSSNRQAALKTAAEEGAKGRSLLLKQTAV
jgi:hypothetical protein